MTKDGTPRELQADPPKREGVEQTETEDLGLAFSASSHELGFGVESLPLLLGPLSLPAA